MIEKYEPEVGQGVFGQPSQEFAVPMYIESHLNFIREELDRVMWNINQETYDSPFGNSGNSFDCEVFNVAAYDWNDDVIQEFNFKWRNLKISWYKYLGRGMSMNRECSPEEAALMLNECITFIQKMDAKHLDDIQKRF
jgi:hypothetical protein